MSQFQSDTQKTFLSRIPVMLLSFISVVFLTRLLGPEGNGIYTLAIAALNFFLTVIGFQLESALPVFLAKDKSNKEKIFSATAVLAILSVLAVAIILLVSVYIIPGGYQWITTVPQLAPFTLVVILLLYMLRKTSMLIQSALRGLFLFKAFNRYMVLTQLFIALAYGGWFFYTISTNLVAPIAASFIYIVLVEIVLLIVSVVVLWRSKMITFSPGFKLFIKPVFKYSAKSLLSSTGQFLNKRLDVWFVQFYRGTAVLGQYGLASQITNFVSDALLPFHQVMIPYIAGSPQEEHKAIVERTARLNILIALTASIVIISTSWLFIPLIFSSSFYPAVAASQILAIGIVFISQQFVFASYFRAINKLRIPAIASWAGVLITVTLDIFLIPKYGIIGAAWATTLAYATTAIYLIVKAKHVLGFSMKNILFVQVSDIRWMLSKNNGTV